MNMRLLAIIPAYQAVSYLKGVIESTKDRVSDILVIDDGSTDGTSEIAKTCGAEVIRHDINRGKGAALKTGFAYAVEKDYEAVITLDADGQHDPKFIPDFLSAQAKTGAAIVIGSRMHDKADMPWQRRCSNYLTSRVLSILLHTKIEDSQSGYRLIRTELLKNLPLQSDRYQLETEIIIKAVKAGHKVAFVPIKVIYGLDFPTSISGWTDTFRWLKLVLREIRK
jgi:glycosyltransferase involved in cell wall biosynthesis